MHKPAISKTCIFNATWMSLILWALIIWVICAVCACHQRQVKYYEYDPDGLIIKEWSYKSNSLASEQGLDWLYLDLPNKGKLWFGPYTLDNDSMKVITPWGIVETEPK